jgi:hypothetical protein
MAQHPLVDQGLIIETSRSHSDTPQSVGLLLTGDQPDAEIATWQHTTLTRVYLYKKTAFGKSSPHGSPLSEIK